MSALLLDTNIISEITKPAPHPGVVRLLENTERSFLSVISLHELHYGVMRLPDGRRRTELQSNLNQLFAKFDKAVLDITRAKAVRAANMRIGAQNSGRTIHLADALIAATALEHELVLVTRNVSDFVGCGIEILNPWDRD